METVKGGNPLEAMRWQKEEYKVAEQDKGMLTQADFFALLTKELSNQDPTKPVDNNEIKSILESSEDDEDKKEEEKREYAPTSLVKKSPDEVKLMATLTPSEVNWLIHY